MYTLVHLFYFSFLLIIQHNFISKIVKMSMNLTWFLNSFYPRKPLFCLAYTFLTVFIFKTWNPEILEPEQNGVLSPYVHKKIIHHKRNPSFRRLAYGSLVCRFKIYYWCWLYKFLCILAHTFYTSISIIQVLPPRTLWLLWVCVTKSHLHIYF